MYADDVQLNLSSPVLSITVNVNKLNDYLDRIYYWAKGYDFRFNPHQSKCIFIHRSALDSNIVFDIVMNGEKIKIVDAAIKLGSTFNDNLAWTNHVNTLLGQTYMKRLIAKCYLLHGLVYGCEHLTSCNSVSKKKLNVLSNNIVRYVYGLRRSSRSIVGSILASRYMYWLIRLTAGVQALSQALKKNKIQKLFLRRFPLSRFLAKTLRENKIEMISFSKNLSFGVDFKL